MEADRVPKRGGDLAHRDERGQDKNADLDLLVPEIRIGDVGDHKSLTLVQVR
jgi:hypothetical protein